MTDQEKRDLELSIAKALQNGGTSYFLPPGGIPDCFQLPPGGVPKWADGREECWPLIDKMVNRHMDVTFRIMATRQWLIKVKRNYEVLASARGYDFAVAVCQAFIQAWEK